MSIRFENVFYTYQEGSPFSSTALENINLTINDGDFLALVGHTGSGKSTLAQLINGLLIPSKGRVVTSDFIIDSKDRKIKNNKNLKKYAGLVFQFPEYQLFESTVIKDVAFGPKNFSLSEEEAIKEAAVALKKVGIDESLFEKSPFELSGGQKRRVAIAGIIALKPKVLILDEPTAGLDPIGSKEMMDLFKMIHQEGTTIVMISHDMDNVLKYANRVVVMNKGSIVCDTTPRKLFLLENLSNDYNIHEPLLIAFAKSLIKKGLEINLENIVDIDSLIQEIRRVKNG